MQDELTRGAASPYSLTVAGWVVDVASRIGCGDSAGVCWSLGTEFAVWWECSRLECGGSPVACLLSVVVITAATSLRMCR
jgi:hypothetical protein